MCGRKLVNLVQTEEEAPYLQFHALHAVSCIIVPAMCFPGCAVLVSCINIHACTCMYSIYLYCTVHVFHVHAYVYMYTCTCSSENMLHVNSLGAGVSSKSDRGGLFFCHLLTSHLNNRQ